jgi:hypothetical protein
MRDESVVQRFNDGLAMVSGAKIISHGWGARSNAWSMQLCCGTTDEAKVKALISQFKLHEFGWNSSKIDRVEESVKRSHHLCWEGLKILILI